MDSLTSIAASGMRSRLETLDLLANNIANSGTTGYKADQESYNLYFGESAWEGYDEGRPSSAEMPVVQKSWTDLSQGTLVPTGNSTDFGLATTGFFTVQGPSGPLYTRNGNFRLSNKGILETHDGYPLQSIDGKPVKLEPNQDFQVTPDGEVKQNGQTIAQILVAAADVSNGGERFGGYFKFPADTKIARASSVEIQQGKIETSNVTPSSMAVKLISVLRSFEMLQKAVTLASDMTKHAIEEVARVNS